MLEKHVTTAMFRSSLEAANNRTRGTVAVSYRLGPFSSNKSYPNAETLAAARHMFARCEKVLVCGPDS